MAAMKAVRTVLSKVNSMVDTTAEKMVADWVAGLVAQKAVLMVDYSVAYLAVL